MRRASELRVLIADDEPLARRGVRQLLAPYDGVAVVGEARHGRDAVRLIRREARGGAQTDASVWSLTILAAAA